MKTLPFIAIAAFAVASAQAVTYQVALTTGAEVPSPLLPPGPVAPNGTATVSVNSITGGVSVNGVYKDMSSNVSAAHIHGLAGVGATAGVIQGLTVTGATVGSFTGGGTLTGSQLTGLLGGLTYLNVHTSFNGSGEIRGQIADPSIRVFSVNMSAFQEVPSPSLGGFNPTGLARVVLDSDTGEVEVSGTYSGLTSNATAAHIHGLAGPGATAGVLVGLTVSGGQAGTFTGMGTLTPPQVVGLLQGNTYLNLHTANNGPGEIRGQIGGVIPEPTASLLAILACAIGLALRRRK